MSFSGDELLSKIQQKIAEQNEVIREQQVQIQEQQQKIQELEEQISGMKNAEQERATMLSKLAELVE